MILLIYHLLIIILLLAMDLDFEHQPEAEDVVQHYAKPIKGNTSECLVCMMSNSEFEKYQLVCGHQYHTRCYRKWLDTKHKLACSVCGDIPQIRQNAYCCICEDFYEHDVNTCGSLHGLSDAMTRRVKYRYTKKQYLKPCDLQTKIFKKDN